MLELKPLPLTAQQASSLRLDAVRRVVAADAAPVQHLRASVLASLATRSGPPTIGNQLGTVCCTLFYVHADVSIWVKGI